MALTEAQWQAQVIDLATLNGWLHFHPHDSRRSVAGWPDLVLCRPPQLLFVELKTDTGKLRPEQDQWLHALTKCTAGVEHMAVDIWRPADFDYVAQILAR